MQLLAQDWIVQVFHVYREADQTADWLAGEASNMGTDLHFLGQPPSGCFSLVLQDVSGLSVTTSRLFPS